MEELKGTKLNIYSMVVQGMTNGEIANALNLHIKTVAIYVSEIMDIVGVRNRERLIYLYWVGRGCER